MLRIRSPLLRLAHNNYKNCWIKQKSTKVASATHGSGEKVENENKSPVDATTGSYSGGVGTAAAESGGRLPARMPLVKNFFAGVVDKELLGFPEVVAREEMQKLQNEILPLRNFFAEEVDTSSIDATRTLPATVLDNVRQLGLFALNAPLEYDGKGWGWSESLMASEPEAGCTDIALGLLSHRVVIDVLKELGTQEQQQRFLSRLASGSLIATEAIFEYNVSEDNFFNTHADFDADTSSWTLNGDKAYVVTGPLAAGAALLCLVIAQTHRLNMRGDSARGTTVFLVDASTPGVKLGEQHLTIGCRGIQMRQVKFEHVRVSDGCVIGQPHDGNQVADVLLRSSRLRNSVIGSGMAKKLVNEMTNYCLTNKQCGISLKDMEISQTYLSKAVCATYAMESMLYMTAGLLDEFSTQDVSLEAAITKYYTLKNTLKIASKCMDMIGPKSLQSGQTTEIAFRNAAQLYTQGETMDTLRLCIALSGLQHAGTLMSDTVHKSRNPLLHPGHIFGKFLQKSNIDTPNTKMQLGENVHPSLEPAAQCIEHSVARLQMCVELLLTRYGSSVVERHSELQRLAEMSTAIYAMFASTARASRSYCIGLQLADHELLAASAICTYGRDLVKTFSSEIFNGQYVNNDNALQRLATQVVKSKGYYAVHPLTYNF